MTVSALSAGLKCRCPNCGEGRVFRGFLTFKDQCDACGADLTVADTGDGASFFVMFAALILIVPSAMFFEFAFHPPAWLHVLIWPPLTFAFCMSFLRPVKALLFALQWKHKAGEGRVEQDPQE
ncbi:MAG: DUF983 domain-containing protein [Hyphomonadaceae bacterium]|jgi:uncharacterized protein (DUF983 family)|nr:DUF983 domain-containing protein [Hyphomonadaceae bacterium]MBP9234666.1 DUF983 domain-containing protein [Hyphomonadaceae bacterium]